MSAPNGSIANLLVTCKSLVTRNLRCPFPVPFPDADDRLGGTGMQIKSRRWKGAGMPRIKSRRWKGAGWAQGIFPAALGGERIAR
jgi:hypothetical protein